MRLYFLIPLVIFLLANCKEHCNEPNNYIFKCQEEFYLKEGESATVVCNSSDSKINDFSITINNLIIEDSRCCAACNCISAGFAKAKVDISLRESKEQIELIIDQVKSNEKVSKTIMLNNRKIEVILKEINPFPVNYSEEERPKTAKMQINS